MPQTQKGSWFLHSRDKMDVELIKTIEATVYEIWRTTERIRALNAKGAQVPPYLNGYLRRLDRDLNKMRSVAVYYREYSSIENLQLLGENYIKQMKRDLTPLTFQTSILCGTGIEIIAYCDNHGVQRKVRLRELGITEWDFYKSRRRYLCQEKTNNETTESFIQQEAGGRFVPSTVTEMERQINPRRQVVGKGGE